MRAGYTLVLVTGAALIGGIAWFPSRAIDLAAWLGRFVSSGGA